MGSIRMHLLKLIVNCFVMRVEARVRKAKVSLADPGMFLGRRQGMEDAGEVDGVDVLGLSARSATKAHEREVGHTRSQPATCLCHAA